MSNINWNEMENKWWQKDSKIPLELNDCPIITNNTQNVKNSEFTKLHEDIDALVYEFMKKHDIPDAWMITYSKDELQSLKKGGVRCPDCDGHLAIKSIDRDEILLSM